MKNLKKSTTLALGTIAALLAGAGAVGAQCNLPDIVTACDGNEMCAGGCAGSFAVQHGAPMDMRGFNMNGTEFANTCGFNCAPMQPPPFRFWAYDNYAAANSGCGEPVSGQWWAHAALDFGAYTQGYWLAWFANWSGPSGSVRAARTAASAP